MDQAPREDYGRAPEGWSQGALTASWKAWVASEAFQEMKAVADEGAIAGEDVPERDE